MYQVGWAVSYIAPNFTSLTCLNHYHMEINIQHQTEKTSHTFSVVDPNNLTSIEVWTICSEMNVKAILVNGKYYEPDLEAQGLVVELYLRHSSLL